MYCDAADKLVRDAVRAQQLPQLPPYDLGGVDLVVAETSALAGEVARLDNDSADRALRCHLFVAHLLMRRNKRCLLAYQHLRAERIRRAVWRDEASAGALGVAEEEYRQAVRTMVAEYSAGFSEVLDIGGAVKPPGSVFVDVRVLRDAGEVATEYGVFTLSKDSQFFARYLDVARLVEQGYVEIVK